MESVARVLPKRSPNPSVPRSRTLISQDLVKAPAAVKPRFISNRSEPPSRIRQKVSLGDNPIHFNFEVFDHLNNLLTSRNIVFRRHLQSIDSQIAK